MAGHDESEPRVTRIIVTPSQIEVLRAATVASRAPHTRPTRLPTGDELRTARDANTTRVPLARLPAPMFGWNTDGETLATLLAPAGQSGAAPHLFHPRAKSVLIDAPPIARPIRRTHKFLRVRPGKLPDATRDGQG
jgi:hypothetical protein